jgi:hypothetical protein
VAWHVENPVGFGRLMTFVKALQGSGWRRRVEGGDWGAGGLLLLEIVHLLLGALAGVRLRARRCDGC